MKPLAPAVLLACLALASAPAPSQTMYRCGNQFQDKPCADGKGKVVGKPAPAAPATPAAKKAAAKAGDPAHPKGATPSQAVARRCMYLRDQLKGANPRAKEELQAQMRETGCAYAAGGAIEKEKACASAQAGKEISETCRAYDKRL
ncbi:MAG TPA: hypothetical protein VF110_01230 [Burkholderiales bacterium]